MQNEVNFVEKKEKILMLRLVFESKCLNMLDIADYGSVQDSYTTHDFSEIDEGCWHQ